MYSRETKIVKDETLIGTNNDAAKRYSWKKSGYQIYSGISMYVM